MDDMHTLYFREDFAESVCKMWDDALKLRDHLTIFHSRAWLEAWSAAYRDIDGVRIYVEEGACGSYFVLPMMEYQGSLRSLSYNATDYGGTIYPKHCGCVPHVLADELLSEAQHRPVELVNVPTGDPLVGILQDLGSVAIVVRTPIFRCNLRQLRATDTRLPLKRKAQRDLARNRRHLMTSGAQIRIGATYSDELLGEMVAVHTRRWNLKGQPGNFADTRRAEFIRGLLRDSAIPAQVSTLVCDDVLLAYRISFLWNSTLAAWNSGMNPDYAQHSPGNVLLAAEMQNALVAGLDTYDLLRGDEAYKSRWANETDSVCTYRVLKR